MSTSKQLEDKVKGKLGGTDVYRTILDTLETLNQDQIVNIAGQVSGKLQAKVRTYISQKNTASTYDSRTCLRYFFEQWLQMLAGTKEEEKELSAQRLVNILQYFDLNGLAEDISEAVKTGSTDSLQGTSGVPYGATPVLHGTVSVTQGAAPIPQGDGLVTHGDVPIPPGVIPVPCDMDDERYKMSHPERGLAIIFNQEIFDSHNLTRRIGTNKDRDNLIQTLRRLGFKVDPHQDKTKAEVMSIINEAAKANHGNADCLVVAVMTHGEPDFLYSKDEGYKPSELMEPFTAEKCRTLAGKPKMFFFQACQGDKVDHGLQVINPSGHATDNISDSFKPMPYTIPIQVDFLIGCSTVPGYLSWRDQTKGSWYMEALCNQLNLHGPTMKLTDILTRVNRQVAYEYESKTSDSSMNKKKQSPCFFGTITRDIILTNKC